MIYTIVNQKNGETCTIEASHISAAMHKARRQMKWANYGNRMVDGVLNYRYYTVSSNKDGSKS